MADSKDRTPSSDRPITTARSDQLGRTRFARELAKTIGGWSGKDSLVVSLEGSWGCGKTSVKNLVLEALSKGGKRKPVQSVCEFAPWEVSGDEKISKAFFDALADSLEGADIPGGSNRLKKQIRKYGSLVQKGSSFIEWVVKDSWYERPVSFLFSLLGSALESSSSRLKPKLADSLAALKRPVLVVIDDIDRLTDTEIALLFRLIKCNGDFPNLVYLLLFDRRYVEDSLNLLLPKPEGGSGRGAEYLKKIVQVSYRVPEPDRKQLEQILFNGLDSILEDVNGLSKFDKDRWNFIFPDGIRPFFKTIRDVNRFLSSLSFYASLFRGDVTFEANPIDLVALELLRVFEEDVYSAVAASKDKLLSLTTFIKMKEDHKADADYIEREIIAKASQARREAVGSLLNDLFPHVSEIRREHVPHQGTFEDWFKARRVCDGDFFDQYFGLHFGVNHITESELQHFLAHLNNTTEVEQQLLSFRREGKLPLLLDALDNYKNTIDLSSFDALASGLMNIGDDLPHRGIGLFGEDPRMSCTRIILFMLSRVDDEVERFNLLRDAVTKAHSYAVAVHVVHILRKLSKEGWGDVGQLFSEPSKIQELCDFVAEQIDKAAKEEVLACSPRTAAVVDFWHQHKKDDFSKNWMADRIADPSNTMPILKGFMSSGSTSSKRQVGWRMSINELAEYVPLQKVDQSLENVEPKEDSDKLVVEAYRLARKKGLEPVGVDRFDDGRYIWSDITDLY